MNIGNNNPVTVNDLVPELDRTLGRNADVEYLPIPAGDVDKTYAKIDLISAYCGFKPQKKLIIGLPGFCE